MVRARKVRSRCTVSNDKRAIEIGGGPCADMFDPSPPVRAEIVVAQAVLLAIDYRFETCLQGGPLRWIDFDLEDRILHPLSEIAASFRDPPQSLCAGAAIGAATPPSGSNFRGYRPRKR
jgi:hypothetical protein